MQLGGAFEGHLPLSSLHKFRRWGESQRINNEDPPSHDTMDRPMRSTFEVLLETNEVRYVSIY